MHAIYLACLVGGAVATALFAGLGAIGGGAHGGHSAGGHHLGVGAHGHAIGGHHIGGAAHVHATGGGHTPAAGQAHAAAHTQVHGQAGHSHAVRTQAGSSPRADLASTVAGWTLSWVSPLTIAAAALWFGGAGLITEGGLGPFAVVLAILAALAGAFLIRAAMAALIRSSTPPLASSAEGALATVNATIKPDQPGEVIFSLEGLTRSIPARSLDGTTILRGAYVAIVKRERGMAWVAPIDSPNGLPADDVDARTSAFPADNGDGGFG